MYEPELRVPSFKALTNGWCVSRAGAKSLMERCRLGSHHSQHTVAVTANNGKQSHASHHTQDTERMPAGQTAAGTGEAGSIYKYRNILFNFQRWQSRIPSPRSPAGASTHGAPSSRARRRSRSAVIGGDQVT